ncbi:MAG: hypothetical protein Nk1A_8350 [Endomicrobiia bacterium]|nr:MAG: hypothetical protein Nk1A_8350 [Endomicrobiia bacterium]
MKLAAISDLHGFLPVITEKVDLVLIGGDISPLEIQRDQFMMLRWFKDQFYQFINNLNCDKVVLIAGNHDFGMERSIVDFKIFGDKLVYLKNELYEYNGLKIFGTPYCHIFGKWPFMKRNSDLRREFKAIPENLDILLTHDPAFGLNKTDSVLDYGEDNLGNVPLRDRLEELITPPKYIFSGHIHTGNHNLEEFTLNSGCKVFCANVSVKNEEYKPIYPPLFVEL